MNEQTQQLIRELADKFGTTAEHLWGVLIRQAGISATIGLLTCAAFCALSWWGYRLVRRKTTAPPATAEDKYPSAEWEREAGMAWFLWGLVTFLGFLVSACTIEGIASALLNPEYWALKQVLQ